MTTTRTATQTVTITDLAFAASSIPGERDTITALHNLVDSVAAFYTFEGEERIGVIALPLGGPASTGGYPIVRFADGMWARCDEEISLVDEGAEDVDQIDALLTAHSAECAADLDPEECLRCHVLWTRRAHANI